jgi:phosphonatase-like hydrolase
MCYLECERNDGMGPIQLVVFDVAGTTVDDSGGAVLRCLIDAVHAHDLPGSDEELNALMGMNKREVFDLLVARRYPLDKEAAQRVSSDAMTTFVDAMRSSYERSLRPLPGVEDTFAYLRRRGIKIATDTGFDATINKMVMERLNWPGRLTDLAVCSSDVSLGRPAPYMIFYAMERLGVFDVRRVMKIGDSPSDMEEGYNAGCGEVIGVLSGAHTAATLGPTRHTRLLTSVADLPSLFE